MGFTHYWYRKELEFDNEKWKLLIADIKKVLADLPPHFEGDGNLTRDNMPISILGGGGTGEPIFDDNEICFNGKEDLSHETFRIERKWKFVEADDSDKNDWKREGKLFDFCKTARKPYSFLAEIVLMLAKFHFQDKILISSDGDDTDWKFSREYFAKKFPDYVALNLGQIELDEGKG
jgi:hypothetical protein